MIELLSIEYLKLKRSPMIWISILGVTVTPIMILAGLLKERFDGGEETFTFAQVFDNGHLYYLMMFAPIIISLIIGYIISREYIEDTIKTVFSTPISRTTFLLSKIIIVFSWILILAIILWMLCFLVGLIGGASNLSINILFKTFFSFIFGSLLLGTALLPLVYFSMLTKNIFLPILVSAAIGLSNIVLSNQNIAVFYPYSIPYLLSSTEVQHNLYASIIPVSIVLITGLTGITISFIHFHKHDLLS